MKKIFLLAIIFLNLGRVCALPVGNPSEARIFSDKPLGCDQFVFSSDAVVWCIGYYGDYVFNRNLETDTHKKIDYSQMHTNAGYLALNCWDIFEVFTTLGVTKFRFNTSLKPFNGGNPSPRFEFESSTAFSWSVGARGVLFEYKSLSLGVEGQYFSTWPSAKRLFVRANVDAYPDESSQRKFSEWQVGAGISYRYSFYFVPYIAIKYADVFWEFDNQTFSLTGTLATIPNLRNRKRVGYAIGATFAPFVCQKIAVTVEGRFSDETAVYVNGHIYF